MVLFILAMFRPCMATEDDLEPSREAAWQQHLEQLKFQFHEADAGLAHSIEGFVGDSQLHIVCERNEKQQLVMVFKLARDGKDLLSLKGHLTTVFRATGKEFYFASFWPNRPGCVVRAYGMTKGDHLWESPELSAFGRFGASAYGNQVGMRLSRVGEVPDEKEAESIIVTGRESYGDYITVIDTKSGKILARRIYRKDFERYAPEKAKP